jgi:ribosomal protein L14
MIRLRSRLKIVDNSGGKVGRCIGVLENKKHGRIGDRITVSIISIRRKREGGKVRTGHRTDIMSGVKRREKYKGRVVRSKWGVKSSTGIRVRCNENAIEMEMTGQSQRGKGKKIGIKIMGPRMLA